MDSKNQSVKEFHARGYILPIALTFPVLLLPLTISLEFIIIVLGLIIFLSILILLQYNMVYVKIGHDFITLKPTLGRMKQTVLFKNITSVRYEPKCVHINYFSKIKNAELTLKIYTNQLTSKTKTELLNTLHTVFKDKEKRS